MADFELYKDAILTVDLPTEGLRAGDVGTVVDRHEVAGVSEIGYSVEFFDMTGNTVAVVTLPGSSLRSPTSADRPSVRELSEKSC
jgi:S1-C subfamily serine protease